MINISGDYYVDVDSCNYTAKRDMHKKVTMKDTVTGEKKEIDQYKIIGYYSNLAGAVKGIVNDLVRRKLQDEASTLEDAIHIIQKTNTEFYDLLEKNLAVVLNNDSCVLTEESDK